MTLQKSFNQLSVSEETISSVPKSQLVALSPSTYSTLAYNIELNDLRLRDNAFGSLFETQERFYNTLHD